MYEVRKTITAAIALLGAIFVVLALAGTAPAATSATATTLQCQPDWYVNPDETALLPKQQEDGLLFDGPSLIHHATAYKLKDLPVDGTFTASVSMGVAPLFKFETSPYSTINRSAGGYWSGKITYADPGGQGNPVATPQELIGKWSGYTNDSTVTSFGVGYANDAGNTALVKSITFAGHKYDMSCVPPTSTSSTPTSSSTPATSTATSSKPSSTTAAPSTSDTVAPSTTSAVAVPVVNSTTPGGSVGTKTSDLAYTGAGASPALVLSIALGLILIGACGIAFVTYRRRRAQR